jgi:hypothetical protein
MGLVLFIHLLPPWRSTSRLNTRLVAQQLTEAKQIMEDMASLLDSSAREAVACSLPPESHVTIVPGLPSVKIQGLSERCTKQLVRPRGCKCWIAIWHALCLLHQLRTPTKG